MIDIIKQTPYEYSKQSRDYQVLARLYTALFNVSKSYIDNMNIWEPDIDNKLALLRAKTLNFDVKHQWDLDNLDAVASCFKYLVRNKGTLKALEYVISILMKIEGIDSIMTGNEIQVDDISKEIIIRLEEGLMTVGIIEDLLKYILPAGFTYRIIEYHSENKGGMITDLWVWGDSVSETDVSIVGKQDMFVGNDNASNDGTISAKQNKMTDTYVYDDSEGNVIDNTKEAKNSGKKKKKQQ